jgi:hypothetical protein
MILNPKYFSNYRLFKKSSKESTPMALTRKDRQISRNNTSASRGKNKFLKRVFKFRINSQKNRIFYLTKTFILQKQFHHPVHK